MKFPEEAGLIVTIRMQTLRPDLKEEVQQGQRVHNLPDHSRNSKDRPGQNPPDLAELKADQPIHLLPGLKAAGDQAVEVHQDLQEPDEAN